MNETNICRMQALELILSLCSGLRKVLVRNKEDIAYNNALGDIFDYIIENESEVLMPGTAISGKLSREYIEYIK